jgi:hypothetical protein
VVAGVSKAAMPKRDGGDDGVSFGEGWLVKRVEWSGAIASKNHDPGGKSLHRKTERVKFNGTIVVSSKLSNRHEIFNNIGNDENIAKI